MGRGRTALLLACTSALLLTACGSGNAEDAETGAEPDPLLVEALVTLHLADARAEATGAPADSLRAVAYDHVRRATGLDSATVAVRLAEAVRRPEDAAALFDRVADSLAVLRP